MNVISPRGQALLLKFLQPKGLIEVSDVEFAGESINLTLETIYLDTFPEIPLFC